MGTYNYIHNSTLKNELSEGHIEDNIWTFDTEKPTHDHTQ